MAYLALELIEAAAVKVHGFEVRSEAGNGGMVRNRINSGEAEEAAVEEVPLEHEFHFGVGMAVDLLNDEDLDADLTADFGGV